MASTIPSSTEELLAAQRLNQQLTSTQVSPEFADLLEEYAQTWPTMTAQAAVGLASQGITPTSDMARQLAEAEGLELLPQTRDHRGIFAKVRDATFGGIGTAVSATGDAVSTAARGVTRTAFTLFDSVQQELVKRPLRALANASYQSFGLGEQDFGSALWEGFQQSGNSTGVVAVRELLSGNRVNLGEGAMPGGDIAEDPAEQARLGVPVSQEAARQQSQIQIGGAGADFGDLIATAKFDPESADHQLWSGVLQMGFDIASDPIGGVGSAATKVRKARQALGMTQNIGFGVHVGNRVDEAGRLALGLVDESKTVLPEVVRAYTRSDEFAPIADAILDPAHDAYDVAQSFGWKLDPQQIRHLREAAGREELASRIDDMIQGTASIGRKKVNLRPVKEQSRWRSVLPTDTITLREGRANAAAQLDRALIAAKVPRAERAAIFDKWTEVDSLATARGRAGARGIVLDGYKTIERQLVSNGADPEMAKRLTDVYGRVDDQTKYVMETLGDNPLLEQTRNSIAIGGEAQDVNLRLVSELAQEIPLPNIRQISLEMTGGAMNSKLFKSAYAAELAASDVVLRAWVPMQLLRGAWTVRVVGEEQVRMAVSGFDSMFSHPGSFISWAIGKKGDADVLGRSFADDELFEAGMANNFDAWHRSDAGRVATGDFVMTRAGEPGHWSNTTQTLKRLHDDPLARRVARGESTDEIIDFLFSAEGKSTLDDVASSFPVEVAEQFATDPNKVRSYIDGFTRQVVSEQTQGVQEVLDLVATGKLGHISFNGVRKKLSDDSGMSIATQMAKRLKDLLPEEPALAVGPRFKDASHTQRLDQFVDVGMSYLMGKPTNYLSRSVTWKQDYWRNVLERVGAMTDEVRQTVLKNAEEAFAGGGLFGGEPNELLAIRKAIRETPAGTVIDDMGQLDTVAKAEALATTRDLLYDQARRHQWVDLSRGIFVFAEAWREIATTWLKLASAQPTVIRRAQQGIEGARDAGVFYTDPMSGDEMFTYPAGGWTAKMFGVVGAGLSAVTPGDFGSVPFEGDPEFGEVGVRQTAPVSSLNLFSQSVLPGVGPVVSVSAATILPDIPETAWLREVLFPFGDDEMDDGPGGIFESALPSWQKKMWQGWREGQIDRSQYANARFDVMRALSMRDPERYAGAEGQQKLLDDSVGVTNNLFAIRATEQLLGAPAAPRTEFFVRDMNGQAFNFAALTKAYWDIFEEVGGDHSDATVQFIDRFGVSPDLLRQGKTRSVNKRAITEPGAEWERRHSAQAKEHPEVIGYFAPEDYDAQLDSEAFNRATSSGDREQLDNTTMLKAANSRTGYIAYKEATRRLEAGGVTGVALSNAQREIRKALAEMYPGFGETLPVKGRLRPTEVIPKLKEALSDPELASTPTGQALAQYFKARDAFLEAGKEQFGVTTLGGKRVLPYRQALNDIGSYLVTKYEGFASVWDEVLSSEIKSNELEQEGVGLAA